MNKARPRVYLFNWPSPVGGAGTKVTHLLRLLHRDYEWIAVPNTEAQFSDNKVRAWLHRRGIKAARWEELPAKLEGWGLCLCNTWWLTEGRAAEAHARGLRLVWSSEMMWHHLAELGAVAAGVLDAVLFVSSGQRLALASQYALMAGATDAQRTRALKLPRVAEPGLREQVLSGRLGRLRWVETGNYIDPVCYAWRDRRRGAGRAGEFVIGRLSRAAVEKFPADFPDSYESLGLQGAVRARVMAWSDELAGRWPGMMGKGARSCTSPGGGKGTGQRGRTASPRSAGGRAALKWDLLPAMAEEPGAFLRSLDLFVYELGAHCRESWGRAAVEAMLCGAVPLLPRGGGHHLEHLLADGVAGFLCADRAEFAARAQELQGDAARRFTMSRNARRWAAEELCDAERHRRMWRAVFAA